MRRSYSYIGISAFVFVMMSIIASCGSDDPVGNNPPSLVYTGIERSEMRQGDGTDSVIFNFTFADIDGDIGGENTGNIVVTDNRDGSQYISLSFPDLPSNGNSQQGSFRLFLPNTCCIYPPSANTPACDSNPRFPNNRFTVDVAIMDMAGNMSNAVTTDTITLYCTQL